MPMRCRCCPLLRWRNKLLVAMLVSHPQSQEARHLFYSYVGGIYAQNGMEIVQNWIGQLVDPQFEPQAQFHESEPFNAYKKVKTEAMSPPPPSMPPPPAPIYPPPPMPIPTPTLNPLAPAQPQTAFLPLFNQTANQRRLTVEYPAQFSGPAHAGRWTVQCVGTSVDTLVFGHRVISAYTQSTVSLREKESVPASSLPKRRLPGKHTMPWDGHLVREGTSAAGTRLTYSLPRCLKLTSTMTLSLARVYLYHHSPASSS